MTDAVGNERAGLRREAPPLPVGMPVGGEVGKRRMLGSEEQAHSAGLCREVDWTPEHGDELARQSVALGIRRIEQHFLSCPQGGEGFLQSACHDNVGFRQAEVTGIDPQVPAVLEFRSVEADSEDKAGGLVNSRQRAGDFSGTDNATADRMAAQRT